jgi:hypothetical protein
MYMFIIFERNYHRKLLQKTGCNYLLPFWNWYFLYRYKNPYFKNLSKKWSKFDRKYLENKATKVYLSLDIWKEHVEIDQITNFHEKIIWQSQLYRIPLTAWLKQHRKKTNHKTRLMVQNLKNRLLDYMVWTYKSS